uniref:Uncharacterized protein n=1 Tax=Arundo donax TaxID=35708 RepID=A0A0A9FMH0_ARUDO
MASLSPSLHLPWYAPSSPLLPVNTPRRLEHELPRTHESLRFSSLPSLLRHAKCCRRARNASVAYSMGMDLLRFLLPGTCLFFLLSLIALPTKGEGWRWYRTFFISNAVGVGRR